MKLNHAPQAGLRKSPPGRRRETMAFWGGIAILVAFELILMAKSWSPDSIMPMIGYDGDRERAALDQPAAPEQPDARPAADPVN